MKRYDALIFDSVNFAYKTFKNQEEFPVQISKKTVYRNSVCNFINKAEELKKNYLDLESGQLYFLFDNYYSKADLKSTFMFADRKALDESYKANRTKESKSFYNSLNLLRYYYLTAPSIYHTARIDNLEADDLVKPLLLSKCKNKTCLFITSDLDWCRYLTSQIDWLPSLNSEPKTVYDVAAELGFEVNEKNIIMYKALFGDKSDNVDGIISESSKHKEEFIKLTNMVSYPEELILLSRDSELVDQFDILKILSSKDELSRYKDSTSESRYQINIQLVSSIPCSPSHLESVLTTGRNAVTLNQTIKEAIGLVDTKNEFVFGNIKRPRA